MLNIPGLGIAGYRSFGPTTQTIGPCRKINILIGQNNTGKSNLLRLVDTHWKRLCGVALGSGSFELPENDRAVNCNEPFKFGVGIPRSELQFLVSRFQNAGEEAVKIVDQLLVAFSDDNDTAWFWFEYNAQEKSLDIRRQILKWQDRVKEDFPSTWWQKGFLQLAQQNFHPPRFREAATQILRQLLGFLVPVPEITLIPAIRGIATQGTLKSGTGLVDHLARFQNPDIEIARNKEIFRKINTFVEDVTGLSGARLEIPYRRDVIRIEHKGRNLPLAALGTGIEEVIIIAANCTILSGTVVCLEEPEIHLHPTLQRKLIRHLAETDNQFFLSTHSAHLIDTPDAAIFHLTADTDGWTLVDDATSDTRKSAICSDLGYHASDLLQSNSVIWVEGPSDRIYLNHWIRSQAPDLVEGLHYSIMFYGGRLLSHLSADDPELNDFISLRRLNRNISILIDSDRQAAGLQINHTKRRVANEFDEGPGFAWITAGREVENYIPRDILLEALKAENGRVAELLDNDQFAIAYEHRTMKGETRSEVDKVKLAHCVCDRPAFLEVLDLKEQLERLIAFIRSSNPAVRSLQ